MHRLKRATRAVLVLLTMIFIGILHAGIANAVSAPVVTSASDLSLYTIVAQNLTCASNGVASSPATCSLPFPARESVLVTCNDVDGCTLNPLELGAWDGYPIKITNVSANTVTLSSVAGVTQLVGPAPLTQWQGITLAYAGDRYVEIARATPSSGGAYSAAVGSIPFDVSYFSSGSTVIRYVDPTLGSDTACDGKSANPSSGGNPCAWASVQRALDDVPNGFFAQVDVHIAAGTYATPQVWNLYATPGSGGTVSNPIVRVRGNCSTPTATFSSMGSGTALVSVTGGGKTGGVTMKNQYTFTPTVSTGSITGVTDGSHYLVSDYTAGASPVVNALRASTAPTLIVVAGSGTLAGTKRLCPYNTIFSALNFVGPTNATSKVVTVSALQISGIEVTSNNAITSVNFIGVKMSGSGPTIRDCNFANSVSINRISFISTRPGAFTFGNNLFKDGVEVTGTVGTISGVFSASTNPNCLWVNGGIGLVAGNTVTGGGIQAIFTADFEGTCTGIAMRNSHIGLANGTGGIAMDITGRFLKLENNSSITTLSQTTTGKRTLANQILSGSDFLTNGTWSDTNVSVAGEDILVGGLPVVSYASLASTPLMDFGSGSSASLTGLGPTSVPTSQGGTGTTMPRTSCTLAAGTCTATVTAGCECFVTPEVLLTAVPYCTVSGVTATVTAGAVDTGIVNIWCPL